MLQARTPAQLTLPIRRLPRAARDVCQPLIALPLATRLRLGIAVGCGVLATAERLGHVVVILVLLVLLTEVIDGPAWMYATTAQALLAGVTVVSAAGVSRGMLPLLLLASFRAGDRGRRRHVMIATASSLMALGTSWWLSPGSAPGGEFTTDALQWLGLATALGLLQSWSIGFVRPGTSEQAAAEATLLVARLQDLVLQLPNGLHAPAVADELLDAALALAPCDRGAVLVRVHENVASPLVLRGCDRVPWGDPVQTPGTPARAWASKQTVVDVRHPETNGRRGGSTMICVPLLTADDVLIGLVVIERLGDEPISDTQIADVERAVCRYGPQLQAALLFSDLQMVASVTERERLAREMHDGVAQDLVALAFLLDALGRDLRTVDAGAEASVTRVRDELTRVIGDIRFSIADLRSSVRPERGLGAALSSQVQSLAASTKLTTHLSLRESTFRLPAHVETALLRTAQACLHDVRTDPTASEVWVSLDVESPSVTFACRHDGVAEIDLPDDLRTQLQRLGVMVEARVGELHVRSEVHRTAVADLAGSTLP